MVVVVMVVAAVVRMAGVDSGDVTCDGECRSCSTAFIAAQSTGA
jgi:hypothetical protein